MKHYRREGITHSEGPKAPQSSYKLTWIVRALDSCGTGVGAQREEITCMKALVMEHRCPLVCVICSVVPNLCDPLGL